MYCTPYIYTRHNYNFMSTAMIKKSNGNYTTEQILRCSRMAGTLRSELKGLLSSSVMAEECDSYLQSRYKVPKADVKLFVDSNATENLFTYFPDREHTGFAGFVIDRDIKTPHLMGHKLKHLSWEIEKWDNLVKVHRERGTTWLKR